MSRVFALTIGLAGLALAAGPLHAQTGTIPSAADEVMVRVGVKDIAEPLAVELGVGTDVLPRSVEVPVEVAAVVCDIPVEQLEHVRAVEQHIECKAVSLSNDLAAATEKELKTEEQLKE